MVNLKDPYIFQFFFWIGARPHSHKRSTPVDTHLEDMRRAILKIKLTSRKQQNDLENAGDESYTHQDKGLDLPINPTLSVALVLVTSMHLRLI